MAVGVKLIHGSCDHREEGRLLFREHGAHVDVDHETRDDGAHGARFVIELPAEELRE